MPSPGTSPLRALGTPPPSGPSPLLGGDPWEEAAGRALEEGGSSVGLRLCLRSRSRNLRWSPPLSVVNIWPFSCLAILLDFDVMLSLDLT